MEIKVLKKNIFFSFVFFSSFFKTITSMKNTDDLDPSKELFFWPDKNQSFLDENLKNIPFKDMIEINVSFELFRKIASNFIYLHKKKLERSSIWFYGNDPFLSDELNNDCWMNIVFNKIPYAILYSKKLIADPNFKTIVFTDLHGDENALNAILLDIKNKKYMDENCKLQENCFLIGLGDYVDRGPCSINVLSKLMLISIKNPQKVLLLRGNHESVYMNSTMQSLSINSVHSFLGNEFKTTILLAQIYETMISNFYLGSTSDYSTPNKFLFFSHALLNFSYDPTIFLNAFAIEINCSLFECFTEKKLDQLFLMPELGSLWHDIESKDSEIFTDPTRKKHSPLEIFTYWKKYSSQSNQVIGMIGGHQHYLPKRIQGIDNSTLSNSVACISVENTGIIKEEILKYNTPYKFDSCFPIIKFVSSSISIGTNGYPPTYLEIYQDESKDWVFQAVPC